MVKKHRVRKRGERGKQGFSEVRILLAIMKDTKKLNPTGKSPSTKLPHIQAHTLRKNLGITDVNRILRRLRDDGLIQQVCEGRDTGYCMVKNWKSSKFLEAITKRYYKQLLLRIPEGLVIMEIGKQFIDGNGKLPKNCGWFLFMAYDRYYQNLTPDKVKPEEIFNLLSDVLHGFIKYPKSIQTEDYKSFVMGANFLLRRIIEDTRYSKRDQITAVYFLKILVTG